MKLFNFCGIELSASEENKVDSFIQKPQKEIGKKVNQKDEIDDHIVKSISYYLDHRIHERFCEVTGNHRNYISRQP